MSSGASESARSRYRAAAARSPSWFIAIQASSASAGASSGSSAIALSTAARASGNASRSASGWLPPGWYRPTTGRPSRCITRDRFRAPSGTAQSIAHSPRPCPGDIAVAPGGTRDTPRRSAFGAVGAAPSNSDPELRHDRRGNLVLHSEHVIERAIVGLRPQMRAVGRANQLRGDSDAIAGLSHRAFQHVGDLQSVGDRGDIQLPCP